MKQCLRVSRHGCQTCLTIDAMKALQPLTKVSFRDRIGLFPGVGIGLWAANLGAQRIFGIDRSCTVQKHFTSRVLHASNLIIEDECQRVRRSFAVSGGCYINCADGLYIGAGTIFAPNVAIVSQTHDLGDLDCAPPTAGIRIGRSCWIGFSAFINPGITLGDRTVVGANSVVTQSFPEGHLIIAGAPARVVRRLS